MSDAFSGTGKRDSIEEMMLSLLQQGRLGAETVALAAELLAADVRFNIRAYNMKNTVSDDSFLEIVDLADAQFKMCETAVQQFNSGGSASELNQALIEIRRALENAAR
jgi:hypothetical protein